MSSYILASPAMHIHSVEALYHFIDAAEVEAVIATAITDLSVELAGPVPVAALRQCLLIVTNIVDLVLLLPFDTPAHFLIGLAFPKLELLKTNLPHDHLAPFLASLPNLSILCLGSCGRAAHQRACALRDADLDRVRTMECPAGCASSTAREGLEWLTIDDRYSVIGIPQALTSFRASSLSCLSLDFFPDDYDVLCSVIPAAPRLRKLKLVEKHRATRRQVHARRAWNDAENWYRWLLKLSFLEEFALRTAAAFVRVPASVQCEKMTLLRWTEGTKRKARSPPHHPTLHLVRVWYRCRDAGNGVITNWSRYTGVWRNTLLKRDPYENTLF